MGSVAAAEIAVIGVGRELLSCDGGKGSDCCLLGLWFVLGQSGSTVNEWGVGLGLGDDPAWSF